MTAVRSLTLGTERTGYLRGGAALGSIGVGLFLLVKQVGAVP